MAEKIQPLGEHLALEQDIQKLSKEIKERGLAEKGKEALRTVIREQAPSYTKAAGGQSLPKSAAEPSSPLPSYLQQEPADVRLKVEKLLDFAWHKGVFRAFKEAQKGGQLVLDAFHDSITDKLYEEFKKRGLL